MVSVRKKTRKNKKEEAIKQASSAMFDTVGFFLNIKSEVKSVEEGSLELKKSANELTELLLNYLEPDDQELPAVDAVPESRMSEIAGTAKKQAFDLAKLGLIIPFLLNKESREYLAGFISGLVGEEALGAIKATLIGITGVLTGVFAYKLFKQIGTTFEALRELSRVTSVLFGITSDANSDLETEKEKLSKDKKEIEKEKKRKAKEDKVIEEKKRNAKSARDDLKKEKQALKGKGKLSKLFAFATKIAPNVGKKLLTAIPFVGAFATIGMLLYEIYDEAVNFFDEGEREPPKVDAVKEEEEDKDEGSKESEQAKPVEKAPVTESAPAIVKQASSGPAASETSTEASSGSQEQPVQESMSTVAPTSASEVTASASSEGESGSGESQTAVMEMPSFTMPKTLNIAESSEEIVLEKKDVSPTVIVNNIDNTTTVAKTEQRMPVQDTGYRYSTTVGT